MKPFPCAGFWATCALLALSVAVPVHAQFTVEGREVDIHGFFTQGFMYSSANNYLTAPTNQGTFALTDAGLNISSSLTSKLHVGAQVYTRNVGNLGDYRVTVDWASADYRFNDFFGIRAGQVKTVFGLYNDTQDMEFLHTWALLPQALYPLDLRGLTVSHLGGDAYGTIPAGRAGTFSYTAYGGRAPADDRGGEQYALASFGFAISSRGGNLLGTDVKWATPVPGVQLGVGLLDARQHLKGENVQFGGPFTSDTVQHVSVFSAQYSRGPWKVDWERSRTINNSTVGNPAGSFGPAVLAISTDQRGWYGAIAYRISKYVELGAYHSRFYPNADRQIAFGAFSPWDARHIFDTVFTVRLDFTSYCDLKIEGHMMDGYGNSGTSRGLYPQDNPQGLVPRTNLLVIRLGFAR